MLVMRGLWSAVSGLLWATVMLACIDGVHQSWKFCHSRAPIWDAYIIFRNSVYYKFVKYSAHVMLACTDGFSPGRLPVVVAGGGPWAALLTCAHRQGLRAD